MDERAERHYAALDLGSNSFHMLIAQDGETLRIIDKLREPVRLGAGLDAEGRISQEAQLRALECAERFGQRLRELPTPHVRIVGTNTLRRAREQKDFRLRLAAVLGHPVEIISGDEEARLIYLGVAHDRSDPGRLRLVLDIGGGSTELILGRDAEIHRAHSLFMGCVSYTRRFFGQSNYGEHAFMAAETAALLELRAVRRRLLESPWELGIAVSGTCTAIAEILQANGWGDGSLQRAGLDELRRAVIQAGSEHALTMPGLQDDRRPVLVGGLAILRAVFASLGVERMEIAEGALREGLLYDLIGRDHQKDIRHASVAAMQSRFGTDRGQADGVAATARALAGQLQFTRDADGFDPTQFLDWGAQLHELGLCVAYTGYHRHGAYLVENANIPGFSRDDTNLLAFLIRGHRRSLHPETFKELSGIHEKWSLPLCVLLRLAVLLNRGRGLDSIPRIEADFERQSVELGFEDGWLDKHPLTRSDLDEEREVMQSVGVSLRY